MIELNDDNDPMLFCIGFPQGRLICQLHEVVSFLESSVPQGGTPTKAHVIDAIRKTSRTPDVALALPDEMLFAAYTRMCVHAEKSGKG